MSLLLLGFIWVACKETLSRPLRFAELGRSGILGFGQVGLLGLIYGGATLITNWIPDYLSLIESRYVMERLSKTKSPLARLLWLGLDGLLTLSIAFLAIFVGAKLILPLVSGHISLEVGCFTEDTFTMGDAWVIFTSGLRFSTPPATLNYDAAGIYIYSTFLTSLWIWLYLAAGWLIRSLMALRMVSVDPQRPMPKMSVGALLSLSLAYWPSWAMVWEPKVDVHILHVAEQSAQAAEARARLEEAGLSVSAGSEHNRNAELVLALPDAPGEALAKAQQEEVCGQRPHRSIKRTYWRAGPLPERIVRWAKKTSPLLSRDQLVECRALMGMEKLPTACPNR